ncbi:hypothetical protein P692DRAFT_20883353 [Suillus brevipes Sb2]|nr:hypothetical protein P692DRAFT_20883353 [Suillus brevipes Sb2]
MPVAHVVSLNLLNIVQTLIIIALALDIVRVVLSLLGTGPLFLASIIQFINLINQSKADPQHICTSPLRLCMPNPLHGVLPLARVLALLPPLVVLFFPRVIYLSAQSHGYTEKADETSPYITARSSRTRCCYNQKPPTLTVPVVPFYFWRALLKF